MQAKKSSAQDQIQGKIDTINTDIADAQKLKEEFVTAVDADKENLEVQLNEKIESIQSQLNDLDRQFDQYKDDDTGTWSKKVTQKSQQKLSQFEAQYQELEEEFYRQFDAELSNMENAVVARESSIVEDKDTFATNKANTKSAIQSGDETVGQAEQDAQNAAATARASLSSERSTAQLERTTRQANRSTEESTADADHAENQQARENQAEADQQTIQTTLTDDKAHAQTAFEEAQMKLEAATDKLADVESQLKDDAIIDKTQLQAEQAQAQEELKLAQTQFKQAKSNLKVVYQSDEEKAFEQAQADATKAQQEVKEAQEQIQSAHATDKAAVQAKLKSAQSQLKTVQAKLNDAKENLLKTGQPATTIEENEGKIITTTEQKFEDGSSVKTRTVTDKDGNLKSIKHTITHKDGSSTFKLTQLDKDGVTWKTVESRIDGSLTSPELEAAQDAFNKAKYKLKEMQDNETKASRSYSKALQDQKDAERTVRVVENKIRLGNKENPDIIKLQKTLEDYKDNKIPSIEKSFEESKTRYENAYEDVQKAKQDVQKAAQDLQKAQKDILYDANQKIEKTESFGKNGSMKTNTNQRLEDGTSYEEMRVTNRSGKITLRSYKLYDDKGKLIEEETGRLDKEGKLVTTKKSYTSKETTDHTYKPENQSIEENIADKKSGEKSKMSQDGVTRTVSNDNGIKTTTKTYPNGDQVTITKNIDGTITKVYTKAGETTPYESETIVKNPDGTVTKTYTKSGQTTPYKTKTIVKNSDGTVTTTTTKISSKGKTVQTTVTTDQNGVELSRTTQNGTMTDTFDKDGTPTKTFTPSSSTEEKVATDKSTHTANQQALQEEQAQAQTAFEQAQMKLEAATDKLADVETQLQDDAITDKTQLQAEQAQAQEELKLAQTQFNEAKSNVKIAYQSDEEKAFEQAQADTTQAQQELDAIVSSITPENTDELEEKLQAAQAQFKKFTDAENVAKENLLKTGQPVIKTIESDDKIVTTTEQRFEDGSSVTTRTETDKDGNLQSIEHDITHEDGSSESKFIELNSDGKWTTTEKSYDKDGNIVSENIERQSIESYDHDAPRVFRPNDKFNFEDENILQQDLLDGSLHDIENEYIPKIKKAIESGDVNSYQKYKIDLEKEYKKLSEYGNIEKTLGKDYVDNYIQEKSAEFYKKIEDQFSAEINKMKLSSDNQSLKKVTFDDSKSTTQEFTREPDNHIPDNISQKMIKAARLQPKRGLLNNAFLKYERDADGEIVLGENGLPKETNTGLKEIKIKDDQYQLQDRNGKLVKDEEGNIITYTSKQIKDRFGVRKDEFPEYQLEMKKYADKKGWKSLKDEKKEMKPTPKSSHQQKLLTPEKQTRVDAYYTKADIQDDVNVLENNVKDVQDILDSLTLDTEKKFADYRDQLVTKMKTVDTKIDSVEQKIFAAQGKLDQETIDEYNQMLKELNTQKAAYKADFHTKDIAAYNRDDISANVAQIKSSLEDNLDAIDKNLENFKKTLTSIQNDESQKFADYHDELTTKINTTNSSIESARANIKALSGKVDQEIINTYNELLDEMSSEKDAYDLLLKTKSSVPVDSLTLDSDKIAIDNYMINHSDEEIVQQLSDLGMTKDQIEEVYKIKTDKISPEKTDDEYIKDLSLRDDFSSLPDDENTPTFNFSKDGSQDDDWGIIAEKTEEGIARGSDKVVTIKPEDKIEGNDPIEAARIRQAKIIDPKDIDQANALKKAFDDALTKAKKYMDDAKKTREKAQAAKDQGAKAQDQKLKDQAQKYIDDSKKLMNQAQKYIDDSKQVMKDLNKLYQSSAELVTTTAQKAVEKYQELEGSIDDSLYKIVSETPTSLPLNLPSLEHDLQSLEDEITIEEQLLKMMAFKKMNISKALVGSGVRKAIQHLIEEDTIERAKEDAPTAQQTKDEKEEKIESSPEYQEYLEEQAATA